MIAKRLGGALALSRRAGNSGAISSVCTAGLQPCPAARTCATYSSHERGFHSSASSSSSSSYMSAFHPSMPAYAKRRPSPKTEETDEIAEEEEDDDDDGDLFAMTSFDAESSSMEQRTTIASGTAASLESQSVSFEEAMESMQERIHTIQDEGLQANVGLSTNDWNTLLASAKTVTDLKTCLKFGRQWKNLNYHHKGGISPFNMNQARSFIARCDKFNCPELALYAMGSRPKYGLDIDLRLARKVQASLVNKLMDVKKNRSKLYRDDLIEQAVWKVKVSDLKDEMEEANEEGAQANDQERDEGDAKINRVKGKRTLEAKTHERRMQIVDHTMALAEMTKLFREGRGSGTGPDHVSVLLCLRGMIEAFKVNSGPCYDRDLVSRLKSSLEILSSVRINAKDEEESQYTREEIFWLQRACKVVQKTVSMHQQAWFFYDTTGVVERIDALITHISDQCKAARVPPPPPPPMPDNSNTTTASIAA